MDLVNRAKALLVSPKTEWPRIAAEPATIGGLFTGYAMILAAIPAIAGFIGVAFVGIRIGTDTYKLPMNTALTQAVVQYVLSLVGVFVYGKIIEALAPTFGGVKDPLAAMKVAVWLAGIFGAIPMLAVLGILGLYSLYLIYTGLPVLMRCPPDKALVYTAAIVVCGFVIGMLIGLLTTAIVFR
jgi:hypothetical protein